MTTRDGFAERERALEDEFFRRKEQELIEKMRQRTSTETARQQLREATGVIDEELLQDFQQLGYTRETVQLVHLMPLIQVAWAEGSVSTRERELILEAARSRGIAPDNPSSSAAYEQLKRWLDERPSQELSEKSLRLVSAMLQALPPEQSEAATHDLVAYCTQIAEASGGILGFFGKTSDEEQAVLKHIAAELERNRPQAAQQIVKGK